MAVWHKCSCTCTYTSVHLTTQIHGLIKELARRMTCLFWIRNGHLKMAHKSRRKPKSLKSDIPSTNIKGMAKPRSQSCCEHREIGKARQKATLSKCKKNTHTYTHSQMKLALAISYPSELTSSRWRSAQLSFPASCSYCSNRARSSPQTGGGHQSLKLYSDKVFTTGMRWSSITKFILGQGFHQR